MSYVYVNTLRDSFKVWGADLFVNNRAHQGNVVTYWGRTGTPMQKLCKRNRWFYSVGEAHDYFHKKVKEKRSVGYIPIENHIYFDLIEDKPISQVKTFIQEQYKKFGYQERLT